MKIILSLLTILLAGCASIVSSVSEGHPNRKTIVVPVNSKVIMLDGGTYDSGYNGVVRIHRGAGAFRSNVGRVEVDGKLVGVVQERVTGWVIGNFFPYNGVILGFIVDFAGGGAFSPKYVPLPVPVYMGK